MTNSPTDAEVRLALHEVERGRQRVIDQIGMPSWYWWGLAGCWIGLGVLNDVASAWVVAVATFTFGAVHSAVSQRLLGGRRRTSGVKVRADVAGTRAPLIVFGFLIALAGVTVAAGFATYADGAEHPGTMASVLVAVIILLGGPRVMAAIRARRPGPRHDEGQRWVRRADPSGDKAVDRGPSRRGRLGGVRVRP